MVAKNLRLEGNFGFSIRSTPTWTPSLLSILPFTTDLPVEGPPIAKLRLLGGDSETNRGPRAIPFAFQPQLYCF
jgi:hypothetical protein